MPDPEFMTWIELLSWYKQLEDVRKAEREFQKKSMGK
jgi:hypothetical protein